MRTSGSDPQSGSPSPGFSLWQALPRVGPSPHLCWKDHWACRAGPQQSFKTPGGPVSSLAGPEPQGNLWACTHVHPQACVPVFQVKGSVPGSLPAPLGPGILAWQGLNSSERGDVESGPGSVLEGEGAVTLFWGGRPVWPRRQEKKNRTVVRARGTRMLQKRGLRAQAYRHRQHPAEGCQLDGGSLSSEGRGRCHALPCLGSG